jgi:hypothetical protein
MLGMFVLPALSRLRQGYHKDKISLRHIERPCWRRKDEKEEEKKGEGSHASQITNLTLQLREAEKRTNQVQN